MFVDYVKQTWLIPHKERFVKAWMNKMMHLGNTTTSKVECAHWTLKRLLQNSLGDLCSVWEFMNNMMVLQHTEIKASFETSTHVIGHVFKVTLYKKLLGMVLRYALKQIVAEFKRVSYAGIASSRCGCVMRTTHGLPSACELARYVVCSIPLSVIHMFWRRLSFSDQGLSKPERFQELDVCGKVTLKSKLREISYPDLNSMCARPEKVKTKGAQKKPMTKHQRSIKYDLSYWDNSSVKRSASSSEQAKPRRTMPMLDQFHPCIHDSIENIVNVKADELAKWSDEYINLLGGIDRFEELKRSLLVDGLSMVTMNKWMNITDMGYYNVILVSLSLQQSMTFFLLRSQPPRDCFVHYLICIDHVFLRDCCPLLSVALLWYTYCHYQAKQLPTPYISRM
ncbi:hypothetical protein GmHk_05G012869 [Glycine max]|nr:hypothetical protein GmHk_05G012869 [Glycine max]